GDDRGRARLAVEQGHLTEHRPSRVAGQSYLPLRARGVDAHRRGPARHYVDTAIAVALANHDLARLVARVSQPESDERQLRVAESGQHRDLTQRQLDRGRVQAVVIDDQRVL